MSAAPSAPSGRPREILAAVGRVYPTLWPAVDRLRAMRAADFPEWPDWWFLPMQGAYAILSGGGDRRVPLEHIHHVGIVAALAAWRVTQGVYRFDATVAEAVAATPLEGELPIELLYRLPEWCVYIETPGRIWEGRTLHGFWAHLEWEDGGGADELRLVFDTAEAPGLALDPVRGLVPVPLILGEGSLADALDWLAESGRRRLESMGLPDLGMRQPDPARLLGVVRAPGRLGALSVRGERRDRRWPPSSFGPGPHAHQARSAAVPAGPADRLGCGLAAGGGVAARRVLWRAWRRRWAGRAC